MNRKATPAATAEATPETASQTAAIAAHLETRGIGTQLQRIALRLAELGHERAGADALRAAVRCGRVRPGAKA